MSHHNFTGHMIVVVEHDDPFLSDVAARIGVFENELRDGLKADKVFMAPHIQNVYMTGKMFRGLKSLYAMTEGPVQ